MSVPELPYRPSDGSDEHPVHPEASRQKDSSAGSESRGAGRRPRKIPTREECLAALYDLGGLVMMKIVTPAQASAIRRNYALILQEHKREATSGATLSNESVIELLRRQPELLSMFSNLLTEEQLELIRKYEGPTDVG